MGVKRCKNGHYYDDYKYHECPYCDNMTNFDSVTIPLGNNELKKHDSFVKQKDADIHGMVQSRNSGFGKYDGDDLRTESVDEVWNQKKEDECRLVKEDSFNLIDSDNCVQDKNVYNSEETSEERSEDKVRVESPRRRLENEDDSKTVGFFDDDIKGSPVVGWLVCIKGPSVGKDYRIIPERNFIGRDKSNDISLDKDDSVSREKHAIISYNPKKSQFMLIAGDVHGIVYLNGEEIYTNAQLEAGDIIEIGKTTLKFIPFCIDEFVWDKS